MPVHPPYSAIAVTASLWIVRRRPADAACFAGALVLMLALNGS